MNKFVGFLCVVLSIVGLFLIGKILSPKAETGSRIQSGTVSGTKQFAPSSEVVRVKSVTRNLTEEIRKVKIPSAMVKNGEVQRLSPVQQRNYVILAVFFKDDPLMVKIAACESSLYHIDPRTGKVIVGPDGNDVGPFMIRVTVHGRDLEKHGLDPYRFADNVAIGSYLRKRDGDRPWRSTQSCWEDLKFLT